ncbi:hypothetical protein ElyMa_000443800 [Elysia marginata]|uniref:SRCR domain-containing protein n=1 Tax=Elysia marginata TaxID=1093978 RepID=A0AAV4FP19_9GAST|nr:hypothetical protein ElyMa_000443800 [Elysia marginata]
MVAGTRSSGRFSHNCVHLTDNVNLRKTTDSYMDHEGCWSNTRRPGVERAEVVCRRQSNYRYKLSRRQSNYRYKLSRLVNNERHQTS